MKKIIIAAIGAAVMSTSAMAAWEEGKVNFIQTTSTGVNISLLKSDGSKLNLPIQASGDKEKTIIAMALTAQAADRNIKLFSASGAWISVLLAR